MCGPGLEALAGRPRGRKPEPRLGVRAAEPPGPGPRSPDSEPPSARPQLREAARPETGKEGGGQAAKVRSVSWWSFEIVLGPRKLSPVTAESHSGQVATLGRRGVVPRRS